MSGFVSGCWRTWLASALVLIPVLVSLPIRADEAQPIVIRFAHIVSSKAPKGQMALKFKELAEARLPGKVVVRIYPRATMYEDDHVVDALKRGDLELAAPAVSKFGKFTRQLQVFDLPFLFEDMAAVERFERGPAGRRLLGSLAAEGIQGLGFLHNGMKQLSANRPILVPADAAGQSFRIMSSNVLEAQFKAVNARAEKHPFGQVLHLLESHQLDGQENTWSNIYTSQLFRAQSHITESNHGVLDYMVITSTSFWQSLPGDVRDGLEAALDEAIVWGNQRAQADDAESRERIRASGESTLLTMSDAQRQQWVDVMKPVWQQFAPEIGQPLIDAALAANRRQ